MVYDKPRHFAACPRYGLRVAHGVDGAGTVTSVMTKNNKYLCIVLHDSGAKKGHFWSSLTDVGVPPPPSRRGPPEPELVPA